MNTAVSTPALRAPELRVNGLSHEKLGWTEFDHEPAYTRASATIANTMSTNSSAPSRNHCVLAEISMPTKQIQLITTIQITPITVTAHVLFAAPFAPTSRNEYLPAICDRLAITSTSAIRSAQPEIQPTQGPRARVTQMNVVPQSGSTRFIA